LPPPSLRMDTAVVAEKVDQFHSASDLLMRCGYHRVYHLTMADIQDVDATMIVMSDQSVLSKALWRPSPGLVTILPAVVHALSIHDSSTDSPSGRRALDVGAGCGRDAAYLARLGWHVTAVDRDPTLIAKAIQLGNRTDQAHACPDFVQVAARRGSVKGLVRTFGADLSDDTTWMRQHAAHLVVVVRFLRRGVLENLRHAVLPGGFIFYEHFLVGCEQLGGPMKPSQMLQHGELTKLFSPTHGFTIFVDEEHMLADGRPVARFLAQRLQC
jgi:SAM-dependent methyltransferase